MTTIVYIISIIVAIIIITVVIKLRIEVEQFFKLKNRPKKGLLEQLTELSNQLTSNQLKILIDVLKK